MRMKHWREHHLAAAAAIGLLCSSAIGAEAQEAKPIEDITGEWILKDDPNGATVKITTNGNGLLMAEGRDQKSTFQAACISYGSFGQCLGHGSALDGSAGFISESLIRLTEEGEILETWVVRSSEEELSGQSVWSRKK